MDNNECVFHINKRCQCPECKTKDTEIRNHYGWMGLPDYRLPKNFKRPQLVQSKTRTQEFAETLAEALNNGKAKPEKEPETPTVALSLSELEAQIATTAGLEELVTGIFPAKSVNLLAGDSGLGKSPLVCQLAVCLAAGRPFLDHPVRKGRVLFVDFENDAALPAMLRATAKAIGATEKDYHDNLHILQHPSQKGGIEMARHVKADLIIIDSLRGFDAAAESKNEAAGTLIGKLQKETGCWLLMHHLRKQNQDNPRPLLTEDNISVLTWLENVSGGRALVNQTFTRLAIDEEGGHLLIRGFYKTRGEFGPFHVDRIYDEAGEPIGYARLANEQLLHVNQRTDLNRVRLAGKPLAFGDIVAILDGDKKRAHKLLTACRTQELVRETGKDRTPDKRYEF